MTDSAAKAATQATQATQGKRERLIAAAARMLHQQGAEATTLADIAHAASVPVGNVYYYFKAKNDIIDAVIDAQAAEIRAMLGAIEAAHPDPASRLKALFAGLTERGDEVARYGCPHGSLCQELAKHAAGEAPDASRLIRLPIDWVERQFTAMGRQDARDLAIQAIAAYQGTALLTASLNDPSLMERESRRMTAWIDALNGNQG